MSDIPMDLSSKGDGEDPPLDQNNAITLSATPATDTPSPSNLAYETDIRVTLNVGGIRYVAIRQCLRENGGQRFCVFLRTEMCGPIAD